MKSYKNYLVVAAGLIVGSAFFSHLVLKGNSVNLFATQGKRHVTSGAEAISIYPKSARAIEEQVQKTVKQAEADVAAIVVIRGQDRTYSNTIDAISEAKAPLRELAGILEGIGYISPDKSIRDASVSQRGIAVAFLKEHIDLNKALYDGVVYYVENNASKESLTPEQKYFIQEVMREFKRGGVDRSEEERAKIAALNKQLQDSIDAFSAAIANANAFIAVSEDALTGVSESFKKALSRNEKGECIVPCDYPSNAEIMAHCSNPEVRKNFLHAFANRGYPENRENLIKLSALRHEYAVVQGYKNFADYELATCTMAKRVDTVEKFLAGMAHACKDKFQKEVEHFLADVPEGVSGTDKLYPWDLYYIMEYQRQKYYNVDDRKVAEYFPMESTIKGLFSIYEAFLGITFVEHSTAGAWHEDVRLMEVQKDGVTRGYIFLDLFPRPFKYTHACFVPTIPAQRMVDENGKETIRPMVGTIICNFPKATAELPSLLKYDDAVTFFHEFGHALHDVMGATHTAELAGCAQTRIDFVEMPSQMFEEWLRDKEMLHRVTRHYQTGEAMPDEMIDKLLSLITFDSGFFIGRQLRYSEYSLQAFTGPLQDPDGLEKALFKKYMPSKCYFAEENKSYANFGHLTEYSCRYYGYLWSRVFALDLAEHVRERGLLDAPTGAVFGGEVLGAGASVDPDEILEKFLGRKPRQDAFMKAYGLKK